MAINILQIPEAESGYDLTGKKIMVHDKSAPLASSTVLVDANEFIAGGSQFAAPIWKQADGDMTTGLFTFSDASLIGATEMNYIIVNKVIETIGSDYTFVIGTGTITRTNPWQAGDEMITPYKPA